MLFANFFCCLMYSSGLPILYPIACAFNICLYWLVKILLLKFHQRTSRFNERLAIESVYYIKFGILFHMLTGAFMYTNSELISHDGSLSVRLVNQAVAWAGFAGRFASAHAQLYASLVAIIIVIYMFQSIIIKIIFKYFLKIISCNCIKKRNLEQMVSQTKYRVARSNFSDDILYEFDVTNLTEFYKRACRDFNEYK